MTTVLFACVHNAGRSQKELPVERVRQIRDEIRARVAGPAREARLGATVRARGPRLSECALTLIIAIGLATVVACEKPDHFATMTTDVAQRTLPAQGTMVSEPKMDLRKTSASSTWDIETSMAWPAYAQWIESQLAFEFDRIEADADHVALRKPGEGEASALRLTRIRSEGPLRVRAILEVIPN